ncbi:MAG TPA: FtsX-like permease family protein [Lachnospiraceae bacterium]|nr:FtsX-like permease family protein [Lachnospiraceae bacterium]
MLFRKLWRDLIQNKTQFVSIFLMAFLGMFIFVSLDAESNGARQVIERYYEKTNLADFWVLGNGFSVEEEKQVEKLSGVEHAERRLLLTGDAELGSDKYWMQLLFSESNAMSQVDILEGESFGDDTEGIWLEYFFAKAHDLNVGDPMTIKVQGMELTGIIKGLVRSPEYVYYLSEEETIMPNYSNYGFAFMPDDLFPSKEGIVYNQMLIDVDTYDDASQLLLKQQIEAVLDRENVIIADRDQNASYAMFDSEIKQHKAMGVMFSAVFLLIAVLGIITTMTRLTANQRTQIGTLKALGFSKKVITKHYVSYGFWISLIGSIMGAYIGYLVIPQVIFDQFNGAYITPTLQAELSLNSYVAIILSVSVSTFVSYMACRKELRDPPAVTLRPAAPKKEKHSRLEKSKLWLTLSFSTQWNFRDVLRNKARSFMGVAGVAGCTMLMLSAFGCNDAMTDMINWMYGELMTANTKIVLSDTADYLDALDYSKEYSGQLVQEASVEFVTDTVRKTGMLTVVDTGNYLHYQGRKLEHITLQEGGVALTYKMAQSLQVEPGDYIKWHIMGEDEWETTRVSQIYRDPTSQGIAMTRETFEHMEHTFAPTAVLCNKSAPENLSDDEEVQTVMNIVEMKAGFAETMEMMILMIGIMVSGAVILGVVVLYNLGVLSFVEKTREIATLKVLGFKSKSIRGILQKQNIWITSVGIVIGLALGYALLIGICSTISDSMDLVAKPAMLSYLYAIGGTFIVSISVNFILSGKVKTIDMVDALKGVE